MPTSAGQRIRLRFEFAVFYLVLPVVIAVTLPPERMFTTLFAVTALGILLLHLTPNFSWRDLTAGARRIDWRLVGVVGGVTALSGAAVILWQAPAAFLGLPRQLPGLMLMIALLYPFLSALPQEIVFRPLFFRRYASVLPDSDRQKVILNAGVFSLAHLMYWSWVAAAMTFFGGLIFAYAYEVKRNFPLAWILHSVSGVIAFALGLGLYFYSGNVERPF